MPIGEGESHTTRSFTATAEANIAEGIWLSLQHVPQGKLLRQCPMESFWGKMKMEWLNELHFKTIEEAKKMVFEYVLIFHNRQRLHAAFGYQTPYEVYHEKIN